MLKFKSGTSKASSKFDSPRNANSPSLAWASAEDLDANIESRKSSRFSKLRIRNKKHSGKTVELLISDSIGKNAFGSNVFHDNVKENVNRTITKSSSTVNYNTQSYDSDSNDDSITVYPMKSVTSLDVKKTEEGCPVIITVISSDESSLGSSREIKSNKKTKHKIKEKKEKPHFEVGSVIYFKNDMENIDQSNKEDNFPWSPLAYNPEINGDNINDDAITVFQIINIFCHPIYKRKTILIDLRHYEHYQSGTILGAKHISEYKSKANQISYEKIKAENNSLVIFMYSENENHDNLTNIDKKLRIYKIQFNEELMGKTFSFVHNLSVAFTCFELGSIFLSENFDNNLQLLPQLMLDAIITDHNRDVYHRLSESQCNKIPVVIALSSTDVTNGDHSEKSISNSKLMSVLNQISDILSETHRCLILCKDPDNLSIAILVLILMFKNHWSLHDSITCVQYVRCQQLTLKQIYLNVLKNFEKLFFGKRLYSGGNKSKLHQTFALDL